MRDVGFLIWIVLLFVGVGGSIVSSIRKQAQRSGPRIGAPARPPVQPAAPPPAPARSFTTQAPEPGELPQWLERVLQAQGAQPPAAGVGARPVPQRPVAAKPAPASAPSIPALVAEHHPRRSQRLFASHRDLVRAVIAAEVLGKPRGLADE